MIIFFLKSNLSLIKILFILKILITKNNLEKKITKNIFEINLWLTRIVKLNTKVYIPKIKKKIMIDWYSLKSNNFLILLLSEILIENKILVIKKKKLIKKFAKKL